MDERFYKLPAAAERLGVSLRGLLRLIDQGRLEVVRPTDGVRCIAASTLQAFMADAIRRSRPKTTPMPAAPAAATA